MNKKILPALFAGCVTALTYFILPASCPEPAPLILLFLGGFVLAKVIQKNQVDRVIVGHLLRLFGNKPYFILLGFMMNVISVKDMIKSGIVIISIAIFLLLAGYPFFISRILNA